VNGEEREEERKKHDERRRKRSQERYYDDIRARDSYCFEPREGGVLFDACPTTSAFSNTGVRAEGLSRLYVYPDIRSIYIDL
jgi:hypothetical protein